MTAAETPCVFCEIVAERAPAKIVQRWTDAIAIAPLGPVVDGHTLIIPKLHVVDAADRPHYTAEMMARASVFASRFPSFNIITSAGRPATQSVFHLHLHVVPRAEDDGLMVPWGTAWGENPQDPHRCRGMVDLRTQLDQQTTDERDHQMLRSSLEHLVNALPRDTVRLIGSDGADGTKRMSVEYAVNHARKALELAREVR